MGFRRRALQILLRVLLLIIWVLGMVYTYLTTELIISPIMFGLLTIISVVELSWFLQKQERNWVRFLESVKYRDFNRSYHKQASDDLRDAYELITQSMEELQSDKQAEYRLLGTVLGHISIGILCYKEDGHVVFTNKTFDNFLDIPGLAHIDRLSVSFPEIYAVISNPESNSGGLVDHVNGQKLLVKKESFKLKGISHQLVSLADIRSSLEAKEIESYQSLMRVMTHEIMNSTNPVLSLIRVVNKKVISGDKLKQLESKDQQKIVTSLQAIEERTSGILRFVTAYKEISRSVQPRLQEVSSKGLLKSLETLMGQSADVELVIIDELNHSLVIDRSLIHQVLINLIKNAAEALQGTANGRVTVVANKDDRHYTIAVTDNGPGVASEKVNQIFVPFYTTKLEGSGIGLALSRKIIKAHGGSLTHKRVNDETHFIIKLPI